MNTKRSVRVPDALWVELDAVAQDMGVSVSTVIRWALKEYLKKGTRWETR